MPSIKKITTSELKATLNSNSLQIIDSRSPDAYNGWRLLDESRGGHIAGARSLPHKWLKYMDWIEIVKSKDIQPNHKIVIYAYKKSESIEVADSFIKAGYRNVSVYESFVDEWVKDSSLPMEQLKRYPFLVPPVWVKNMIDGKDQEHSPGKNIVIVHAHYRNRKAYLSGHIPGAIDMDTLELESPETWNRRTPEELKTNLEKHGISSNTSVIIYGKFMFPDNSDEFPGSAAGHIGAIRSAVIMMYAGVKDVRVLNGGFQSWKDAGYKISTKDVKKTPVHDFGCTIPAKPKFFIDVEEAKKYIASDKADIVSVRSWNEYIGEVSGYNYIEKKGRIPGSVFGNCGTDAYHMENYRNADHTIRETGEVESIWIDAGIIPDKSLAFYCGTGWRGSEAFYNAWLMGWLKVAVFDGGWFEWSNNPNNPYETGIPG